MPPDNKVSLRANIAPALRDAFDDLAHFDGRKPMAHKLTELVSDYVQANKSKLSPELQAELDALLPTGEAA